MSLSFYSAGHNRALPSFPTRRSSDLLRQCDETPPTPWCEVGDLASGEQTRVVFTLTSYRPSVVAATITTTTASTEALRSEEHTSELQSPCNLVCRLLLEKKKTDSQST